MGELWFKAHQSRKATKWGTTKINALHLCDSPENAETFHNLVGARAVAKRFGGIVCTLHVTEYKEENDPTES